MKRIVYIRIVAAFAKSVYQKSLYRSSWPRPTIRAMKTLDDKRLPPNKTDN
jgi:hypothetical protein